MNSRTNPHNDGAQGVDPSAARSIVRAVEPPLLSPRALEDRRLIHRNDTTRLQADASQLGAAWVACGGMANGNVGIDQQGGEDHCPKYRSLCRWTNRSTPGHGRRRCLRAPFSAASRLICSSSYFVSLVDRRNWSLPMLLP